MSYTISYNHSILLKLSSLLSNYIWWTSTSTYHKTKEDIELEGAKKKQVDDYSYMYSHYFKSMDGAKKVFSEMQECGRLAEIILPLEES